MADNKDKKVLNVPALRFPEFCGEWERHKLSEVCSFYSGGTPSSSKKEYYNGNIPFIRSGELHKDYTELFITEAGLSNSAAKLVETGDLLLALYGATSGDIAISKIKGAINQAILCIRTKQNKKFIESVWNKHVERLLQTYLQGGQGNLSADIVKNIPFYFANSDEQDKLAKFISLLDERIVTQNKIIEKLETLIKGIRHNIFKQLRKNVGFNATISNKHSSILGKNKVDNSLDYSSWMYNTLNFESTPFSEIAHTLERYYNTQIVFKSEALKSYRFTGKPGNTSLASILHLLSLTSPLAYEIKDSVVILYENNDKKELYNRVLKQ